MRKRVLDSSMLISHWHKCRAASLAMNTTAQARDWANRLIAFYNTDAIVTPVYLEMVAGVRNRHELELTRAYLGAFRCIDERRILPSDWDEAVRLAERYPRRRKRRGRRRTPDAEENPKPRDLGDCLIRAIADRLKHDVETLDKAFPG
jgi:predicted nucleic acid-binding protein